MISEKNLNPVTYCCEGDRTVVSGVNETLPAAEQVKYVGLSILVCIRGSDIVRIQAGLRASIALYIISHV